MGAGTGGAGGGSDSIVGVTYFSDLAPETFGAFDSAFVSLFCISAGDPLLEFIPFRAETGALNGSAVTFLTTYVLLVNWTLLPISMAVLVDRFIFVSAQAEEEERQARVRAAKSSRMISYALDPLMEFLTTHYVDEADLRERLRRLFQARRFSISPPSQSFSNPL